MFTEESVLFHPYRHGRFFACRLVVRSFFSGDLDLYFVGALPGLFLYFDLAGGLVDSQLFAAADLLVGDRGFGSGHFDLGGPDSLFPDRLVFHGLFCFGNLQVLLHLVDGNCLGSRYPI